MLTLTVPNFTTDPMPNWFYYDKNTAEKRGPINDTQLKILAGNGTIRPETILETETGRKGRAEQLKGLQFAVPVPPVNRVNSGEKYFDANALGIGFWDIWKKKRFMLKGRARRQEFWMYALIQILVVFPLCIVSAVFASVGGEIGGAVEVAGGLSLAFSVLVCFAFLIPYICLGVRRLHDIGWTGWALLIYFIPYVGGLILLVLMCLDSQRGDNKYGPNPKDEY